MELRHLHIFCNVIERKSFSKAVKNAHFFQQTFHCHIKYLKDHFDFRLNDRFFKKTASAQAGEIIQENR